MEYFEKPNTPLGEAHQELCKAHGGAPGRVVELASLTYQRESLNAVRDELMTPLIDHWREVAIDQETVPLSPHWEAYESLDRAGCLFVVTVRHEGKLVGYTCYVVSRGLHYDLKVASIDVFYVDSAYRSKAGIRLFREAEKILSAEGVQRVTSKVKLNHDVGGIFKHLGYEEIERVYLKRLNDPGPQAAEERRII